MCNRCYNIRNIIMKKKIAMLLMATMTVGMLFTGCGSEEASDKSESKMMYAVEAGSAGEKAAKANSYSYNSVASQADALMEVAAGTSGAAIIDLLMAGAMIGEGTSYPNLKYTDKLTTEEYGIGCRKDSDLTSYINEYLYESYKDGSMEEIAKKYGTQESIIEQKECKYEASEKDSDLEYIKKKGTLIVGITDFAPMDYEEKSGSGDWIGLDADMAKEVAKKLGVEAKFVVIEWDTKAMELDSKSIDVVWNGMTLTNEVKKAMSCTNAYCNNAQVVVVKE